MEQRDGQCLSGHCRDTPARCQISDAVEKVGFSHAGGPKQQEVFGVLKRFLCII